MIGNTSAIGWLVSSIHDDVMDVCGGGDSVVDGHVTRTKLKSLAILYVKNIVEPFALF